MNQTLSSSRGPMPIAVTRTHDAITRLKSYAAVGADGLLRRRARGVEQLREISRRLKPLGKPLLFNMARSGKAPTFLAQGGLRIRLPLCALPSNRCLRYQGGQGDDGNLHARRLTNAIAVRLTHSTTSIVSSASEVVAREKRFTFLNARLFPLFAAIASLIPDAAGAANTSTAWSSEVSMRFSHMDLP